MAAITPVVASDSVRRRPSGSPVGMDRPSSSSKNAFRFLPTRSGEVPAPPSGQSVRRTQSRAKERNAVSKPAVCSRFSRRAGSDGSIAPSSTSLPARSGKSPAYVAPRNVP